MGMHGEGFIVRKVRVMDALSVFGPRREARTTMLDRFAIK
jgi:hypothetical protein